MYGRADQNDPSNFSPKGRIMSQYTFEDIARYAEALMEPAEKLAFESALETDAQLREQLALYRETHRSLEQHFGQDEQAEKLQQTLQGMRSEFFTSQGRVPAKVIPLKKYLRRVVAVAAVAVIALFVWQPWETDLYSEFAATKMVTSVERGGKADTLMQKATSAFNQLDFVTAAVLLQEVVQLEPDNSFAQYYFGVALLQSGKPDPAREVLTKLYEGASAFKYEAAFYMGLSYLRQNDKPTCKTWLERIPADAGNYQKAQSLLNKL